MQETILISLAVIIVLGILAQYLAWRFRLPTILLLLIFGILAGPVTGWIDPDRIFGPILFPFVSLAVAVILFEGGLSLRLAEIRGRGGVLWSLITVGVIAGWLISAGAGYWILKLPLDMAVLLGAILVVTGPTVIIPLLRHVRPERRIGSLIKWEGIIIDPIGALLAVLVYEFISGAPGEQLITAAIINLFKTVLLGSLLGLTGALIIIKALKRYLLPELLQNSVVLMIVLSSFVISNLLQNESGLFTVTVMGIILANQKTISIERIVHFKEDLRVLLISILFIVLSARLPGDCLQLVNLRSLGFLACLIFLARPAAVALSTIGSPLSGRERLFLAGMAPRGIVAAAVSSIFALRLMEANYSGAEGLMSLTFLVIIGTVTFYGISAYPLARLLGISQPHPQGCLILGAHERARKIARALQQENISVLLVDTNYSAVKAARMEGIPTLYGSVFAPRIMEEAETSAMGRFLALTSNAEVNSLAAVHFKKVFGGKEVYQLPGEPASSGKEDSAPAELRGRFLFGPQVNYGYLYRRIQGGAIVKRTNLTEEFTFESLKSQYGDSVVPLFLINEDKQLQIITTDTELDPQPGCILISLVDPPPEADPASAD